MAFPLDAQRQLWVRMGLDAEAGEPAPPSPQKLRQRLGRSVAWGSLYSPPPPCLVWNKQLKSAVGPLRRLGRGRSNDAYFIRWRMRSL